MSCVNFIPFEREITSKKETEKMKNVFPPPLFFLLVVFFSRPSLLSPNPSPLSFSL